MRRPARSLPLLAPLALWAVAAVGVAQMPSPSRSVGSAHGARLEHGVRLEPRPGLRLSGGEASGAHYGTQELVGLLERAAARLRREFPGPDLYVGHLSRREGGPFPPHESHQGGRDADLAYFAIDRDNRRVDLPAFLRFDGFGCTRDRAHCLDRQRTYALLEAFLEDPEARVQWVLIPRDLRLRILAAGRRMGGSTETYERVRRATEPRRGSASHRDHLHVRIYCPVDDRPACVDTPPFYPWYDAASPAP